MSVGRDYMLRKGSGPSAPKVFLDTQVVPRLVDAAGGAEVALDRAARATGVRPSLLLAGATGALSLAAAAALRAVLPGRGAGDARADAAAAPTQISDVPLSAP
ncbi:hypothetical protein [Sphingomonas sp. BK580]|uniref:hypothetical protein n=1 Tax=Sphingomonas sp. BK580 TaxID=2586972 RepID=UPI001608AC91|nr:hypothetical protein [Sphingomonas sp. BK580]MBB3692171.1 hypothetical protein [Sphingomonas sp. BK580]